MTLRSVEARVLACLVEKETTVPDSYPLTAKALLAACNQSTNRTPITHYDDTMVSDALDALKTAGLVRFVHPSHGGRTLRYRQVADEQWGLGRGELGVLAMLVLRGPETEAILRARAERHLAEGGVSVDDALATLMAGAEPFVRRLDRRPGEREARYEQLVAEAGEAEASVAPDAASSDTVVPNDAAVPSRAVAASTPDDPAAPEPVATPTTESSETSELVDALLDELTDLRRRVERLERLFDG